MNEQVAINEEQLAEREERFRYTDRAHPLIKVLFNFQLNEVVEEEEAVS